jgi:hypothetical protein
MGSITVVPFMFIVPGLLQIKIDKDFHAFPCTSMKSKYNGYALVGLGTALSIAGLVVTLTSQ